MILLKAYYFSYAGSPDGIRILRDYWAGDSIKVDSVYLHTEVVMSNERFLF